MKKRRKQKILERSHGIVFQIEHMHHQRRLSLPWLDLSRHRACDRKCFPSCREHTFHRRKKNTIDYSKAKQFMLIDEDTIRLFSRNVYHFGHFNYKSPSPSQYRILPMPSIAYSHNVSPKSTCRNYRTGLQAFVRTRQVVR
jgi:hypothetical protein